MKPAPREASQPRRRLCRTFPGKVHFGLPASTWTDLVNPGSVHVTSSVTNRISPDQKVKHSRYFYDRRPRTKYPVLPKSTRLTFEVDIV